MASCNGCAPRLPFAPECFDSLPDPVLEASRFREAEPATAAVGHGPEHLGVHCMALFGKDRERNDRPRTPAPESVVPSVGPAPREVEMFEREGRSVSVTNVWAMEIEPGKRFLYELSRPGGRLFQVEFDLTQPVLPPPPPWGSEPPRS